jgi:hypothetical protein
MAMFHYEHQDYGTYGKLYVPHCPKCRTMKHKNFITRVSSYQGKDLLSSKHA